jgi:hypothetical protein
MCWLPVFHLLGHSYSRQNKNWVLQKLEPRGHKFGIVAAAAATATVDVRTVAIVTVLERTVTFHTLL